MVSKNENLRIQFSNCYALMTLCVSHFSTSFWEVALVPAFLHPQHKG